jgi:hypothetical protein
MGVGGGGESHIIFANDKERKIKCDSIISEEIRHPATVAHFETNISME